MGRYFQILMCGRDRHGGTEPSHTGVQKPQGIMGLYGLAGGRFQKGSSITGDLGAFSFPHGPFSRVKAGCAPQAGQASQVRPAVAVPEARSLATLNSAPR